MKPHCSRCTAWGLLLLRSVLGIILLYHGYEKLFGESAELMVFFESTVLPAPGLSLLIAGLIEFIGGIVLILGLFTRLAAKVIAIEFAIILLFVRLHQGFEALEFELLIFSTLVAISCLSAGSYSLEYLWQQRSKNKGKGEKGGHGQEAIGG